MSEVPGNWVSRLRPTAEHGLPTDLALGSSAVHEIPCIGGRPVNGLIPAAAMIEASWPNLAGVLEEPQPQGSVLWDRSLAPTPRHHAVVPYGDAAASHELRQAKQWFDKLVRRLEQLPGVQRACPSDVPRAILLTPGRRDDEAPPPGVLPVSDHLGEFPGGVAITFRPHRWGGRERYAGTIEHWLSMQVAS